MTNSRAKGARGEREFAEYLPQWIEHRAHRSGLNLRERFVRHHRRGDGCWEWTGSRMATGLPYGRIAHGSILAGTYRQDVAHRVAWMLRHGPIPDGLHVLHHCDNPPCVKTEPDEKYPNGHLFLGTPQDNMDDKMRKGRYVGCGNGERNPAARLREEDVRRIRERRARGETLVKIGRDFDVSESCVSMIYLRKNWSHVS